MIKIKRADRPPVLTGRGRGGDRYSHDQVVATLWQMQHQKCCYCERRLAEEGHETHVEHFRPMWKYPRSKNSWPNLLLACANCNGRKGKQFPLDNSEPLLLNPTDRNVDPEDHLEFIVDDEDALFGSVRARDGSVRGQTTIETLHLSGFFLMVKRIAAFRQLFSCYTDILAATDETSKSQAVLRMEQILGANSEFAAWAREFARAKSLDQRFGLRIPRGAELGGQ